MIVGLIGYPVTHSLSAVMHNAAFAHIGWHDWRYELWNTPHDELPARMAALRDRADLAGCNVTIPHKQNVVPYLNEVSAHAQAIGAVNTIVKKNGGLYGDNTDWLGWLTDLRANGYTPNADTHTVVLGAGGSARAIVYALLQCDSHITIVNRNLQRAQHLAESIGAMQPITVAATVAELPLASIGLVVYCTSAGMSPNDDGTPWPPSIPFPQQATLYDLVYKPRMTRLMQQAKAANAQVVGGIGMLVEQGAAAFAQWTGVPAEAVSGVMSQAIV